MCVNIMARFAILLLAAVAGAAGALAGPPAASTAAAPAGCAKLHKPGAAASLTTFPLKPGAGALALFESKFNAWSKAHPDARSAFCWAKPKEFNVTCISIWQGAAPKADPLAAELGSALAAPAVHDAEGNPHMLIWGAGGEGSKATCQKLLQTIPQKGALVTYFANYIKPEKWAQGRDHFTNDFLPSTYSIQPRRAMIHWADDDAKAVMGISIWEDSKVAYTHANSAKRQALVDAAAPFLRPPGITREYGTLVASHLAVQ